MTGEASGDDEIVEILSSCQQEAEKLFRAGMKPIPLTREALEDANQVASKLRLGPNPVIREPENNEYGRFIVLARSDGLYAVHDPDVWPPNGPVYRNEVDARVAALIMEETEEDRRDLEIAQKRIAEFEASGERGIPLAVVKKRLGIR
jgi:hypothetical protein